jgi:hypothetical protein
MVIAVHLHKRDVSIFVSNWYLEIGYYNGSCAPLGAKCVRLVSISEGYGAM